MPCKQGSQPCESMFRQVRSMSSTYSTVVICSMLDIIQRIQKIQLQSDIIRSCEGKIIFPRLESKERNTENATTPQYLPNESEIIELIEKAKADLVSEMSSLDIDTTQLDFTCHVTPTKFQSEEDDVDDVDSDEEFDFDDADNDKVNDNDDEAKDIEKDLDVLSGLITINKSLRRINLLLFSFYQKKKCFVKPHLVVEVVSIFFMPNRIIQLSEELRLFMELLNWNHTAIVSVTTTVGVVGIVNMILGRRSKFLFHFNFFYKII